MLPAAWSTQVRRNSGDEAKDMQRWDGSSNRALGVDLVVEEPFLQTPRQLGFNFQTLHLFGTREIHQSCSQAVPTGKGGEEELVGKGCFWRLPEAFCSRQEEALHILFRVCTHRC